MKNGKGQGKSLAELKNNFTQLLLNVFACKACDQARVDRHKWDVKSGLEGKRGVTDLLDVCGVRSRDLFISD